MKNICKICALVCAMLLFFDVGVRAVADEPDNNPVTQGSVDDASIHSGCHSVDAQIPLLGTSQIVTNAQSVFLYERHTDTTMYAWNADLQMSPSSLVKIMTAYIASENGNLSEIVTIKDSVLSSVPSNAVSSKLQPDEVITVEDLLYCMMVGSGNDAAAVIADHISGSQEAFIIEMNEKAAQLGCTGTQFTNVHGLHDDNQVTTARDTCRILSAALENETFRTVFSTVSYTVPKTNKSEARELITGNFLMTQNDMQIYYDSRVTGGRTGTANDGSRCLAATAQSGNMELISIVMGAKSVYKDDGYTVQSFGSFNEAKQLFDAGFTGYKAVQILHPGQILMQRDVDGGVEKVSVGVHDSRKVVLPDSLGSKDLSYRYADLNGTPVAPVTEGSIVSNVQVWYGNICVAQSDLYAMNAVFTQPVAQVEAIDDDDSGVWKTVLIVVFVVVGCLLLAIAAIRIIPRLRQIERKKRGRRYRQGRRRIR